MFKIKKKITWISQEWIRKNYIKFHISKEILTLSKIKLKVRGKQFSYACAEIIFTKVGQYLR